MPGKSYLGVRPYWGVHSPGIEPETLILLSDRLTNYTRLPYVCVRERARARVCVSLCVCKCESEGRERESERDKTTSKTSYSYPP